MWNTPSGEPPLIFWFYYAVGGLLLWIALFVVWSRVDDFYGAAEIVCGLVGQLTWIIGAVLAAFWLASFAFSVGLLAVVTPVMGIGWVIDRLRRGGSSGPRAPR